MGILLNRPQGDAFNQEETPSETPLGAIWWARKQKEVTGTKINSLTIISHLGVQDRTDLGLNPERTFCRCVCDCGKEVIVRTNHLRNGHTKSAFES
jgi:hypothetical protein